MINIEKFIQGHPAFDHADDMAQVTKPLNKLGISYFAHVRLDNNNNAVITNNHPNYLEHYFSGYNFNYDLHMADIESHGFFLWDLAKPKGNSEKLYQLAQAHGVGHLCTLVRREAGYKHYYHFGADPHNDTMNTFYTQHMDLLDKYLLYYNEQFYLNDNLFKLERFSCPIGHNEDSTWESETLMLDQDEIAAYLESIGSREPCEEALNSITRREFQCAHYMLHGMTSKEIGAKIHISPRTVEVYLERLRNRFGSKNKIELARHLIEAGFLEQI
ncbi:MAG: hypothetical protein CMF50_00610 [Legionellales bacterium]|nr:hypothetical protein [Legionellales bacterium]|tara:strand:+ start:29563 stop:30381 length:819 start_codon:yes stop_codon:yes gene_type:complete